MGNNNGIQHIGHTHAEKLKTAWCGRTIGPCEWTFTSIDHAAYSASQGYRLIPCARCVAAVVKALRSQR